MNTRDSFFLGLLGGAVLMYLLDPDRGARRRALVGDQLVHATHEARHFGSAAKAGARDLRNRAYGTVAKARARLHDEPADDTILEERVRAALGRIVPHVRGIGVRANAGQVTLTGTISDDRIDQLVGGVERVRGVREVISRIRFPDRSDASLEGA